LKTLKIAIFHNLPSSGTKRALFEATKILAKKHVIDLYNLSITDENFFDLRRLVRKVHTFEYRALRIKRPFGFLNIPLSFLNFYRLDRVYRKVAIEINRGGYDVAYITISYYNYLHAPGIMKYLSVPNVYYFSKWPGYFNDMRIACRRNVSSERRIYSLCVYAVNRLNINCYDIYNKHNLKKANLVLCPSCYVKEYLYKTYRIPAKINYHGVNTDEFKPLNIPKENIVISVGHLEKRKAHDFIINAIAGITPSIRPRLAIVCTAIPEGYRRQIEDMAGRKKVSVLFFNRPLGDMADLYNKAKITVCAYINEPLALSPLESMACETPIVAVNEGGSAESIIHKEVGLLTERNISEFSQAIEYLLQSDDVRIKMGKAGRQYVLDNWSWKKSVEELEAHLLKICDSSKSKRDSPSGLT